MKQDLVGGQEPQETKAIVTIQYSIDRADTERMAFVLTGLANLTHPDRLERIAKDSRFPLLNEKGEEYGYYIITENTSTIERLQSENDRLYMELSGFMHGAP